jgi:hypothetical protein
VLLGYRPEVTLEAGLRELAEWLPGQLAASRTEAREGPLARGGTP